ncbi:MAG: GH36-type glycosyl hydrolase domain-containing protein [Sedimentisphaeraceae bacterium JB056]
MNTQNWYSFKEKGKCCSIETPDTPRPWQNYIYGSDGNFQLVISQRAKGDSFYFSKAANNFSAGRNYNLLDKESGRCWSVNGGDAPFSPEKYKCRHFPGKTVFNVLNDGIETELLITADVDNDIEINRLTIKNSREKRAVFSLIGFNECVLEGVKNGNQIDKTTFDEKTGAVLAQKCHFDTPSYKYAAFYAADRYPDSYSGSLEALFDADVPRSNADIWKKGRLPNKNAHATKIAMALQHEMILEPGELLCINYGLGLADSMDEAARLAEDFVAEKNSQDIIQQNETYFDEVLNNGQIETEDNILNSMLNFWAKIQLHRQVLTARGAVSHNWRNNLQDAWGWMIFDPGWARRRLYEMFSLANEDGFLRRTSMRVPELCGSSASHYLSQRHGDIATWTALLAGRYVAETGDLDFFKEEVEYAQGKKKASVVDCLINAVQWLLDHKGKHGMILMLDGDWSDPLEEAGKRGIGESPWTTVALVNGIKHIDGLLRCLGYDEKADYFKDQAQQLAKAVNENAWDGQWYIRGITDDGVRFGMKDDPDANVSLMMQAWPIISGVVPQERKSSVLRAIDEHVKTDIGPILYGPPFLKWRPEIGRETVKQPGTGENGSVYVHGAMMLANAEIVAGRADQALDIIKKVLPLREESCEHITRDIPLWMPNFYHGPHSDTPGLSSGIISTGAPAWFFINVCEGFLGIKPQIDHLLIDPLFPSSWKNARFKRQWRGSVFDFRYRRDMSVSGLSVYFNDKKLEDNRIPVPQKEAVYDVEIVIGK